MVDNYKGVFWVDAQTGVVTRFPTIHHKTEYNQALLIQNLICGLLHILKDWNVIH